MYIYLLSKYHTVIATATLAFLAADPGIFYWEGVPNFGSERAVELSCSNLGQHLSNKARGSI